MRYDSDQRIADWKVAHRMYHANRDRIFIALFARSLPATYCSPSGAATLDPTPHGYGSKDTRARRSMIEDAFWRLRNTTLFIDEMFFTNALPPAPPPTSLPDVGILCSSVKGARLDFIRSLHDGWREAIEEDDRTDDLLAAPISQLHLIGACSSFVVSVRETFAERWDGSGISDLPDASEWDAWTRVWIEITMRQGLTPDGWNHFASDARVDGDVCIDTIRYADLEQVSRDVLETEFERTVSGVRLLDNLRRDLEDGIPMAMRPLVSLGLEAYGAERVNRLLLLQRTRLAPVADRLLSLAPKTTDRIARLFVGLVVERLFAAEALRPWEEFAPPSKTLGGRTAR